MVESLDRISRQTVRKAVRTMEDIVAAGVNLVDLSDGGRRYSVETLDNDQDVVPPDGHAVHAGHEESAMKSRRLLAVYENKRAKAKAETRGTVHADAPGVASVAGRREYIAAIPERAAVIQSIFQKADEGWGQHRIAQWLNEQGTPTWGGHGKQRKAEHGTGPTSRSC